MRSRSRTGPVWWGVALVTAAGLAAGCSANAGSTSSPVAPAGSSAPASSNTVPVPPHVSKVGRATVSGPVTGGQGIAVNAMPARLASQFDYEEREYFIDGTATAYQPEGAWGTDGRWAVTPGPTAPFRSRMIVRAPRDGSKFNGTVVVEWFNTTSGRDADPDFGFAHEELLRSGTAYVGVTAQAAAIKGGGLTIPIPGYDPKPLAAVDPARYSSLQHPGDDYSYDIFSQAAETLRAADGIRPLGDLQVRRVIAAGESQSAIRMVTYANAVQPVTGTFDGFFIHSRGGTGAPANAAAPAPAKGAHIRDDLTTPVLQAQTETDLFGLSFYPARQPDTDRLRTWEMAGTAHADQSTIDFGVEGGRQWDKVSAVPDFSQQCGTINDGPQGPLIRAAFAALIRWVETGRPPPSTPLFDVPDGQAIARDARGNALGGIRSPDVDAPTRSLSGVADTSKSVICSLFGTSAPLDAATLRSLYPTHQAYVDQVTRSADAAVAGGVLRTYDRDALVAAAEKAEVPPSG